MDGRSNRGEVIYALDPAQIQVNDIVLISSTNFGSWIVRTGTLSKFGHAALCTRPGMLFEAVTTGVMRRSVIGTYSTRQEWIRVLRTRGPLGPNAQGLQVADYAERMYGRAYSIPRAAASVFPWIDVADDGSTFCSRVIAEAFHEYGVDLLPWRHHSKIYPNRLLESPHLLDVTDTAIRVLGSRSDANLFEEVVATANQEYPGAEMQMNRRVFEAIRRVLGDGLPDAVISLPDVCEWLSMSGEHAKIADPTILQTLRSEGYVEWYERWIQDVEDNAQLFENIASLVESAGQEPAPSDMQEFVQQYQEYLALDDTSLRSRKATMDQFSGWAHTTGLSTLEYLRDKYRREYATFERLNRANVRLLQALIKMTS